MKSSTLRAWSWLHKWSSLAGTVFLLLLCVTGLPLIFHDEIEHAFEAPLAGTGEIVRPAAGAGPPTLDDFIAHAAGRGLGRHVNFVLLEDGEPYVQVGTSDSLDREHGGHTHWYERATGAVLETPGTEPEGVVGIFMEVMLRLHTDLYAGLPGTLFLGAMGVLLTVALISGVVLYAPFMRKLSFRTIRRRSAQRTRWLYFHNVLGLGTALWVAVIGLTGTINALELPLGQLWRADHLLPMIQRHAADRPPATLAPLADVLAAVHAAAPGTEPASIIFPGMTVSGPRHFLVIAHGNRPATRQLIHTALVDGQTGRLAEHAAMPWYVQALSLSQPLHFGDYGWLSLKILWAVLDVVAIIVLGSGVYLWLRR
ncbi:PepSY-associated TM helix [Pigmentiphaga humi]|uniref:PepSY-associated TM helix n=1 Tax=Pigmentiphaga humi TaxID=2478468 RepID=A0A3P4AXU3_9BURK|nr:PepSY-associated TM helix domain-containing protein [Pigmentiphaga humi]VCU68602.1 PepSY-associated TM helix [Pigmentiphaga humi]